MIRRYVLHVELHRGRWPRVSLRRAPRAGDRLVDGGILGTLVPCPECGGGFLHRPDEPLTDVDRLRYVLARGLDLPARLFGLPQVPRGFYARPRPAPAGPYTSTPATRTEVAPPPPPAPEAGLDPPVPPLADALRAHPLRGVISETLRWGNPAGSRRGAPTDRIVAVAYGGSHTWQGDPEDVADLVLRAIAAAPSGPVTREAWLALRAATTGATS